MNDKSTEAPKSEKSAEDSDSAPKRTRKPAAKSSEDTEKSAPAARRSSSSSESARRRPAPERRPTKSSDTAEKPRRTELSAVSASKKAVEQFSSLTGRAPESVVGVHRVEEGWHVKLEVVESRRIPDSADLLAEYDVNLSAAGELQSYERLNRYVRGRPSA